MTFTHTYTQGILERMLREMTQGIPATISINTMPARDGPVMDVHILAPLGGQDGMEVGVRKRIDMNEEFSFERELMEMTQDFRRKWAAQGREWDMPSIPKRIVLDDPAQ